MRRAPITCGAGTDLWREPLCGLARTSRALDQARGGGRGGLREMPASRGRSVGGGSIVSRGNIPAADGDGGSKAACTRSGALFEVDPFLAATASAVSSA